MPLSPRWRRIRLWSLILAAVGVGVVLMIPVVLHEIMKSRRNQLVDELQRARQVRIQSFDDIAEQNVLQSRDLDMVERSALIRIIQADFADGPAISIKMCFSPHHRVVMVDPSGASFTFLICFGCDQAKFEGTSDLFEMTPRFSANLRRFFEERGIPVEAQE